MISIVPEDNGRLGKNGGREASSDYGSRHEVSRRNFVCIFVFLLHLLVSFSWSFFDFLVQFGEIENLLLLQVYSLTESTPVVWVLAVPTQTLGQED